MRALAFNNTLEMSKNIEKRNVTIDVMKGMLIVLMVAGHTLEHHRYCYLFHMAAFFLISGWLIKDRESGLKNTLTYILHKIKTLYLPYLKYNLFYLLLMLVLPRLYKETISCDVLMNTLKNIVKIVGLRGRSEFSDPSWFLAALLLGLVMYDLVRLMVKSHVWNGVVAIGVFLVGLYVIPDNMLGLGSTCTAYLLLYTGHSLRYLEHRMGVFDTVKRWGESKTISLFVCLLLIGVQMVLLLIEEGEIHIVTNNLLNPVYFVVASVTGFALTYLAARFVSVWKWPTTLFTLLGQKSLHILCIHLFVFRIVDIALMSLYNIDVEYAIGAPSVRLGAYSWIIYTLFGLCVSVTVQTIWTKMKLSIKKTITNQVQRQRLHSTLDEQKRL